MARLAIAGGGAAVGAYFGGPVGAQVGFMVGSIVGNLLFPPDEEEGQVIEGPRLDDLSVSSSTFGSPIAIAYGTVRVAGNLIWSDGIEEVKNIV